MPSFRKDDSTLHISVDDAINTLNFGGGGAQYAAMGGEFELVNSTAFDTLKPELVNCAGLTKVGFVGVMLQKVRAQLLHFADEPEKYGVDRDVAYSVFAQAYSCFSDQHPAGKFYRDSLQKGAEVLGLPMLQDLEPSQLGVIVGKLPDKQHTIG